MAIYLHLHDAPLASPRCCRQLRPLLSRFGADSRRQHSDKSVHLKQGSDVHIANRAGDRRRWTRWRRTFGRRCQLSRLDDEGLSDLSARRECPAPMLGSMSSPPFVLGVRILPSEATLSQIDLTRPRASAPIPTRFSSASARPHACA